MCLCPETVRDVAVSFTARGFCFGPLHAPDVAQVGQPVPVVVREHIGQNGVRNVQAAGYGKQDAQGTLCVSLAPLDQGGVFVVVGDGLTDKKARQAV